MQFEDDLPRYVVAVHSSPSVLRGRPAANWKAKISLHRPSAAHYHKETKTRSGNDQHSLDGARVDGKDQFESEVLDLRDIGLEELCDLPPSVFLTWLVRAVDDDADPEGAHTGFQSQI